MKVPEKIKQIKESLVSLPSGDFLKTGTELFAAILGNDFSDSVYNKTFSAADFLDQYDEGNYNEEKTKEGDDKFIKNLLSNIHLSLVITKDDLRNLAGKEGVKLGKKDESLWHNFIFLVAEAKNRKEYPKRVDYERITKILNRRLGSPAVILLCCPKSKKVSLSLIDRRASKLQEGRDVIGSKVSMLYSIHCRKPQAAYLEILRDLNIVDLIKRSDLSQDSKYFDAIVQEWHKTTGIDKFREGTYEKGSAKAACNVESRTIFCRDNIDVLRGINDECIDLIYLDPPFNKNDIFTAPIGTTAAGASFKDTWGEEDLKDEWVDEIKGEYNLKEYLDSVKNFSNISNYCYLVYMAIRLLEMRRILKPTGSIYYHCDHTMSHYIKILLDVIFGGGGGGFRNEIIWWKGREGSGSRNLPTEYQNVFIYKKTKDYFWDSPRRPFKLSTLKNIKCDDKGWYYTRGRGADPRGALKSYVCSDKSLSKGQVISKLTSPGAKGALLGDLWDDIPNTAGKEKTGYMTQKPLALLERIILASSKQDDMVLDPFCGCATTCIAAERLRRKWIGVDISTKAYELVKGRLEKEVPPNLFRGKPHFKKLPPQRSTL